MDSLVKVPLFIRPIIGGCNNIGANGQTDKKICQKIYKGSRRAYGSKGVVPGKASYNNNICSVKQQLQDAGKNQGNRKSKDFSKNRPRGHINFVIFICFHSYSFSVFSILLSYQIINYTF